MFIEDFDEFTEELNQLGYNIEDLDCMTGSEAQMLCSLCQMRRELNQVKGQLKQPQVQSIDDPFPGRMAGN